MKFVVLAGLFLVLLDACAPVAPPPQCASWPAGAIPVYLVDRGWHTEIGIPVQALDGPLGVYRAVFPGARTILFSYGKKTFFTAPASSVREYLIGPFPGPAVIQTIGLSTTPPEAYGADKTIVFPISDEGARRLSAFIWDDLVVRPDGPRLVAARRHPASLFYAARSTYTLMHTCNGWVAEALRAAQVPISAQGVVFAGQVMARGARAERRMCPASAAPVLP
ncbi:DUF2459 domain-containing protein [Gluconacetobacter johannae]|uniref:DUF2459 domain-containing protein n=1 Tax=Gluconacetobacter johannae TaxID=112140 RepID=A0A7W4J6E2_9PROT|nr:DUF2459 domain-containing protein [Gluconacetobacter johannae]MBB2175328.1 DUF2459 domain-containing protein [Gluconacetobacter johannae]